MKRSAPKARRGLALVLAAALAGVSGCSPDGRAPSPSPAQTADLLTGPVQPAGDPQLIADGFEVPWSLVRLSTGSTLISERGGLVKELQPNREVRELAEVPGVQPAGEGGLLGIEVSEDEAWLYAYTTTASDNRVIRMPLEGEPGDYSVGESESESVSESVVTGIPKSTFHNGGRIKLGPDGMLYITTGDAGDGSASQDTGSLAGKILRVEPDGSAPRGNPFDNEVWSYGHRNVQGITWDDDGQLWASEFGANTWDELNRIERGGNYGWPAVEGEGGAGQGFIDPVYQWGTDEASPSGLAWAHDTFFLAALRGQRLWTVYVDGDATAADWFVGDYSRIRDVIDGPDGTVWMITNDRSQDAGGDMILQVRLEEREEG